MTRHRAGWAAIVALTSLLWPTSADAQTYRCEVNGRITFQQQPCTDGKRVRGTGGVAAEPASVAPLRGAALCESHARSATVFPDPQDVRIASVRFLGAKAWRVHSELIAARSYGLRINPRNRYGGYDGESLFECLLSEDEARVLHFGAGPVPAARTE
jgi:Domain of unknown function (DUF4124)